MAYQHETQGMVANCLIRVKQNRDKQSCRTRVLDLDSSRTRVRFLEDLDLDLDLKGEDLELGL